MNVVAYCRVSTDKDDQLNSLEAQKKFFEEYASRNGYNLFKIYSDEGISGTKIKKRESFKRLMEDAKKGQFNIVIVKDISRFARNTVDFLQSIRQLKALGIETIFLTSNQTVLGNSEFVLTIFGALAQEESANTSKRVKFGKKINAQKGRVPNFVYGYDKIKGDYFNLTINEKEAEVVKKIFNLYINEGNGANKIAQILNNEGYKTKRNCNWSQNAVSRILTNPIYIGKIINGKEEIEDFLTGVRKKKDSEDWYVIEKPELAIINKEDFEKVQAILKKRNIDFNLNKKRESNKHLFSTLIRCSCCCYSFRRLERVYRNTYIKWVCSGRNAKGKDSCINFSKIDEIELIDAIKGYFKSILESKKDTIEIIIKEFNKIYKNKEDNVNIEKEILKKLIKLQKTKEKYMEMYTDDLITRDELNKKVKELNQDIEKNKKELEFIKNNLSKGDRLEETIYNTFKDLENILNMDNLTNASLKKIIDKIVVDERGNVNIYLKAFSDIGVDKNVLISDSYT